MILLRMRGYKAIHVYLPYTNPARKLSPQAALRHATHTGGLDLLANVATCHQGLVTLSCPPADVSLFDCTDRPGGLDGTLLFSASAGIWFLVAEPVRVFRKPG